MVLRVPFNESLGTVVAAAEPGARPASDRTRHGRTAFDDVYREYLGPIYGYCYRRLGSTHAAEDATQQVFTQALAKLHTLRDESPKGWLFTIARNVTANVIRSWRPSSSLDAVFDLAAMDHSPEDLAVAADQSARVYAAMRNLTHEQCEVIELRFSGVSVAETARILRTSEGAVKQLQHRAVLRLRTSFGLDPTGKEHQDA